MTERYPTSIVEHQGGECDCATCADRDGCERDRARECGAGKNSPRHLRCRCYWRPARNPVHDLCEMCDVLNSALGVLPLKLAATHGIAGDGKWVIMVRGVGHNSIHRVSAGHLDPSAARLGRLAKIVADVTSDCAINWVKEYWGERGDG